MTHTARCLAQPDPASTCICNHDERDAISDPHGRPTVAISPVIALGVDEGAAYVKLQNAAAKVRRIEAELVAARQETAQALGEWSQFAKEQR